MNLKLFCVSFLCFCLAHQDLHAQVIQPSTRPNATQQAMITRGYGMFIHFGVNTFTDQEWSDGSTPATSYNPRQLDPDQWVRVARDAGFRYVLLVTKHHDGFCLWNSRLTDYDVASSPVKTDVVKAVSDACRKYGLQFAIYYSLWDRHEKTYQDRDAYTSYMLAQLAELFTAYGPICELWLDGGWDKKPADWNIDKIYQLVKKMSPLCAVSVNQTIANQEGSREYTHPGVMTTDNKYYFQYFPSDFRLWDPMIANPGDKKQYLHNGASYYLPFEHTICLSKRWNWFQKSDQQPVRDLDELQELFYWSTTNKNTLVINVPPDTSGRIREYEANAVIGLGKRLAISRNKPLPGNGRLLSVGKKATASNVYPDQQNLYQAASANDGNLASRWACSDTLASLEIELDAKQPFNRITIFEYQDTRNGADGFSQRRVNRITEYAIDLLLQGAWQTIYFSDEAMGDCKVIRLPKQYTADRVRLRITKAIAPPSIYEFSVNNFPLPE
ncbi:MAG: crotonobetainyl-CoA--carnitine CoA-transferase [Chitinophagaceae bacterium]|nr:MAG: crotonobetainyl-CoA--carnitine CoA-transferase [Chitinophagaceae bacterium]